MFSGIGVTREALLAAIESLETIPGLKILQPWATWFFTRTKTHEIRITPNRQEGWVGFLASGWDSYYDEGPPTRESQYPQFCLLGFGRLVGCKEYASQKEFVADAELHLNPAEFYAEPRYAWVFTDLFSVPPLYYKHKKNAKKAPLLDLIGTRSRCRISVPELLEKVKFFP